jgi:hypothetical protein
LKTLSKSSSSKRKRKKERASNAAKCRKLECADSEPCQRAGDQTTGLESQSDRPRNPGEIANNDVGAAPNVPKAGAARTMGLESDQTAVELLVEGGRLGCAEQKLAIREGPRAHL